MSKGPEEPSESGSRSTINNNTNTASLKAVGEHLRNSGNFRKMSSTRILPARELAFLRRGIREAIDRDIACVVGARKRRKGEGADIASAISPFSAPATQG